jgi:hypothetical protein
LYLCPRLSAASPSPRCPPPPPGAGWASATPSPSSGCWRNHLLQLLAVCMRVRSGWGRERGLLTCSRAVRAPYRRARDAGARGETECRRGRPSGRPDTSTIYCLGRTHVQSLVRHVYLVISIYIYTNCTHLVMCVASNPNYFRKATSLCQMSCLSSERYQATSLDSSLTSGELEAGCAGRQQEPSGWKAQQSSCCQKKCRRKYESMAEPCIISKHNNAESKQCRDKTVFKLCLNSIQNAIKVLTCSFLQQTILLAASS